MNRQITISLISAALVVAAPFAHAQLGPPPAKLDLIKVRDDIYVISNVAVPGLTTALITNEGVLLVDDKFEADHDNIMKMLKTVTNQGKSKADIEKVVRTQFDWEDFHVQSALDGLINEFK